MYRVFTWAVGIVVILALSVSGVPLMAQQASVPEQPPASQSTTQPPVELPDSPGTVNAKSTTQPQSSGTNSSAQDNPVQPSGTAVAPAVQVSGGAASKPAGVAIAPPKQRQIRSWLIKFGLIAGAGAALGTVAALSAASPGHVPGSPGH